MPTKTTTEMRRCTGSARFGIAAHDAPVADFPVQPSRKDGLGTMCAPHWKAYVKGLAADRKARLGDGEETNDERAGGMGPDPDAPAAKPARAKKAPEPKPESPRVRKARATLAATETLGGEAYTAAIGSDEVQAAIETVNGHGTSEPDDGQVLVAGVLYDAETLTEAETPLGETIDGGTEEADAA
jgi:hypothetical protein